ncbi:hypothetical protein SAMN06893096_10819 [Geodermatophilus pulveris]|uniref:Uncharacterized protein n=1 Tax=Geodermatophilus pulveris TaxID=1564159 RepID=A0A239HB82_9ACTN|nr:hypothetical protein [Geodermatophilus pulveris]SNS78647.1 hypothetical protein SAMN06893096_10819 [Geodermatophilus pulveris]
MRRTRRWLTGTVLAVGLGLTGCSDSSAGDPAGDAVPGEEADSAGDADRVDGGEGDADGIDRDTGGIDDDDTDPEQPEDDVTPDVPARGDDSGDLSNDN